MPYQNIVGNQIARVLNQGATNAKGSSLNAKGASTDKDTSCRVTPSRNQSSKVPYYLINGDSFTFEESFSLSTLIICEEIPDPEEKGSLRKEGGVTKTVKKEELRRYAVLRPQALWGPKDKDEFDNEKRFEGIEQFYPTYEAFNLPYNYGDVISIRCLEQPKEMEYTNPGQIKTILEQYDCFIPSPEPPARGQNEKITFLYEDINSAGRAVKSNAAGPVGKITVPETSPNII